jgi:glycosyltransferase involved in cell wall biosynthesis
MSKVAVVIPCYKVKKHIHSVLSGINADISLIYVVDDCCPEKTGVFVKETCKDPRVKVLFHTSNQGVGGAVITGYRQALEDGVEIVIKVDGDEQMDLTLIPEFIQPIENGLADYVKGNRFFDPDFLISMPTIRLLGNAVLSFISKAASGYWQIMDPTNGYTAIHSDLLYLIPLHKLDKRYFFESDMLFRLGICRAVIYDLPMPARYADETSSLNIFRTILVFPRKYTSRIIKRIFYSYFLRDFNIGSVELVFSLILMFFGLIYGAVSWYGSLRTGSTATSGTVMLASLPIILGFQLLLSFISFDVAYVPKIPVHRQR